MNTRTKRITATSVSIGAVAAVIAGVYAFGASAPAAEPAPTPTAIVQEVAVGTTENGLAAEQEADAAAADAARIEAERVAAEAAAAEAARVEAERVAAEAAAAEEAARAAQQTQRSTAPSQGGGGQAPAPAAPVRCPAGSSANSSDGTNDTSCMWDVCFSITLPDAAHPECDSAFRP